MLRASQACSSMRCCGRGQVFETCRLPQPPVSFREYWGPGADSPTVASKEQALLSLPLMAWLCLHCHRQTQNEAGGEARTQRHQHCLRTAAHSGPGPCDLRPGPASARDALNSTTVLVSI